MLTAEQVIAAQKANLETLFGLTQKAFEGVEKLVELNIQASKAALAESANHSQAVLSVKDAQELIALQAGLMQPLAEKTAAYSRHLYDIAAGTGSEFTKAVEAQTSDAQAKFMAVVDNAAKNAPAGSETAVAVMKSAVSAASNAMESEPLAETLAQGDVPSWLLELQPQETSPAAPAPAAAQLPEELSWLEALAEGLPEETPPAVVEPPAQPVVVEPVPPSERPAWLAPTGKLDPSVVERYEQEQAARPAEPPPAPKAEPQPAPTAPPARRVASLQQARQQVVQGQVLPALESYQALIDNMENLEEVRADLRQLVEQHPKEPKVRRLLGDTHMRLGDLQAALDEIGLQPGPGVLDGKLNHG